MLFVKKTTSKLLKLTQVNHLLYAFTLPGVLHFLVVDITVPANILQQLLSCFQSLCQEIRYTWTIHILKIYRSFINHVTVTMVKYVS